jgi:hypothetical protein
MKVGTSLGAKAMAIPEFARWRRPGWQGRLGMVRYAARAPALAVLRGDMVATGPLLAPCKRQQKQRPQQLIKVRN